VALERDDRLGVPVLLLVRAREIEVRLRVLRVLLDLLLRLVDRRAARRGAAAEDPAEVPAQEVADARAARSDAVDDEAACEDEREQDEHPLGLAADALEEERLLDATASARPPLPAVV